jgi:hypothetical protein
LEKNMKSKLPAAVCGSLSWLMVSFGFVACEHQNPAPTAPPVQVQPALSSIQTNIFTPKCAIPGCHAGGAPAGQLSLQANASFNNLVNVVSNGYAPRVRVVPNNANNSVLYLKIIGNAAVGAQMPSGRPPLSATEMSAIQTWINNGAQNN